MGADAHNMVFGPARNWPVMGEYDVVVIGAGPGGIAAAVAAARSGAMTLLVEKLSSPGGLVTHSNVPHIMGLGSDGRQIVGGLADELCRRLDRMGEARLQGGDRPQEEPIGEKELTGSVIANEYAIRVAAARMLTEAGVEMLLYTPMIGAMVEGERIRAVAVDCLEGARLVRGNVFIDASGDAMLVHRAGGRTVEAGEDVAMTKTMIFDVGGVECFDRKVAEKRFNELAAAGEVPVTIQDYFMGYAGLDGGVVHLNFTAVTGNALASRDMTRMDTELREQIVTAVEWFRREIPGFANCWVARNPSVVGVRAGRVGVGVQTITQQDIDGDTLVPQPIAVGIRRYGDHGTKGFKAGWHKPVNGTRPIPYATLLSADFRNVGLAGRCISVEPAMLTCVRYIAQCMATGQAAGTAAAMAADGNLRGVEYASLRARLEAAGAILRAHGSPSEV